MSLAPAVTALIAEDEPLLAEGLRAELRRLWPELEIVAMVGDGESAVREALAQRPAVCFLDIRMPGLTGLQAAQALAEDWPDGEPLPLMVFVTAYDQYALQAFEAQAADYLLKPVDTARLSACVERLQRRLAAVTPAGQPPASPSGSAPAAPADPMAATLAQLRALLAAADPAVEKAPLLEVIQASVGATVHLVPVESVLYFEAADKYVRVVTATHEHLIRTSLRELMPQLDERKFWQVHRSLVVRASAIAQAQRDESGKVFLQLRERPERLTASRLYAHLFKGM